MTSTDVANIDQMISITFSLMCCSPIDSYTYDVYNDSRCCLLHIDYSLYRVNVILSLCTVSVSFLLIAIL